MKKKINFYALFGVVLTVMIAVVFPAIARGQQPKCDAVIGVDVTVVDAGSDAYVSVQPGDRVCVVGGNRPPLTLRNFRGNSQQPVVFINYGAPVFIGGSGPAGILVQNSAFITITGTGDAAARYGFVINGQFETGVSLTDKTTDFAVDHVEVTGVTGDGMRALSTATCPGGPDAITQDTFLQLNSRIIDNFIHGIGRRGIAAGSEAFEKGRELSCNGRMEQIADPVLRTVDIHNNSIESTGQEGIFVGSAVANCHIQKNTVTRAGQGIVAGEGSVCDITNNFVKESGGTGIQSGVYGDVVVGNNIVVDARGNGIFVGAKGGEGRSIGIFHNTLVRSAAEGIFLAFEKSGRSRVQNNLIAGSLLPAIKIATPVNVTVSNNAEPADEGTPQFVDPANDIYMLTAASPMIDQGYALAENGVNIDGNGVARPQGAGFDIGAFEYSPDVTPGADSLVRLGSFAYIATQSATESGELPATIRFMGVKLGDFTDTSLDKLHYLMEVVVSFFGVR